MLVKPYVGGLGSSPLVVRYSVGAIHVVQNSEPIQSGVQLSIALRQAIVCLFAGLSCLCRIPWDAYAQNCGSKGLVGY